jgi:hypothetical protein
MDESFIPHFSDNALADEEEEGCQGTHRDRGGVDSMKQHFCVSLLSYRTVLESNSGRIEDNSTQVEHCRHSTTKGETKEHH